MSVQTYIIIYGAEDFLCVFTHYTSSTVTLEKVQNKHQFSS